MKVAEGYGRNYLLPRKLAIVADEGNKAVIVQMKSAAVRRSAKEKTQAEELAKQFENVSVAFTRKSGENDQLFGSVTSGDIAEGLEEEGIEYRSTQDSAARTAEDRRRVLIPIKLHKDVTAHFEGRD